MGQDSVSVSPRRLGRRMTRFFSVCMTIGLKQSRFISRGRWIHDATMSQTTESKRREKAMATVCKHPRVRIVSRHDDAEFVECLECGEVFDSEEFHDMEIEDHGKTEEAESEY